MNPLVVLAAAGLVIFAIRAVFVLTAGRLTLPASWQAGLDHARPAVLAALLVSTVAGEGPTAVDPRAAVVAGAALVASRLLGMVGTVLTGAAAVVVLAAV